MMLVGGQTRMPIVQERLTKFFGKPPSQGRAPGRGGGHRRGALRPLARGRHQPPAPAAGRHPHGHRAGEGRGQLPRRVPAERGHPQRQADRRPPPASTGRPSWRCASSRATTRRRRRTSCSASSPSRASAPAGRATVQVEVTFDVNVEGILTMSARDPATGTEDEDHGPRNTELRERSRGESCEGRSPCALPGSWLRPASRSWCSPTSPGGWWPDPLLSGSSASSFPRGVSRPRPRSRRFSRSSSSSWPEGSAAGAALRSPLPASPSPCCSPTPFRFGSGDTVPATFLPFALLREGRLTFEASGLDEPLGVHGGSPPYYLVRVGSRLASKYSPAMGVLATPVYLPAALGRFDPAVPPGASPREARGGAPDRAGRGLSVRRRTEPGRDGVGLGRDGDPRAGDSRSLRARTGAVAAHRSCPRALRRAAGPHPLRPGTSQRGRPGWTRVSGHRSLAGRWTSSSRSALRWPCSASDRGRSPGWPPRRSSPCCCWVSNHWQVFGSPLATGYGLEAQEGWTTPLHEGLPGLLVSPARGLLLHAPILLLGAGALLPGSRAPGWLLPPVLGFVLFTVLMGRWWCWSGGYAAGNRMLSDGVPILSLAMAWRAPGRVEDPAPQGPGGGSRCALHRHGGVAHLRASRRRVPGRGARAHPRPLGAGQPSTRRSDPTADRPGGSAPDAAMTTRDAARRQRLGREQPYETWAYRGEGPRRPTRSSSPSPGRAAAARAWSPRPR